MGESLLYPFFGLAFALLVVVLVGAYGASFVSRGESGRYRSNADFLTAGRQLGLKTGLRQWWGLALEGKIQGAEVRIECDAGRRAQDRPARVVVWHPGLPDDFRLRPQRGRLAPLKKVVAGVSMRTFDEEFDRAVLLSGDEALVLAVLDQSTRRAVLRILDSVLAQGAEIVGGAIQYEVPGQITEAGPLVNLVRETAELAQQLALRAAEPEKRLAARLCDSGTPAEKTRCLQLLAARYPSSPQVEPAASQALGDPDHGVRAAALRALMAIGRTPPAARLVVLAGEAAPELAAAAAEALGETGDPAVEEPLAALLDRAEEAVRRAALEALGRLGTAASVPRLHDLADDGAAGEDVRHLARAAIAAIQARIGDASRGRLALAELAGLAGGLALAGAAGALALAPDGRAAAAESPEDLPAAEADLRSSEPPGLAPGPAPTPEAGP